MAHPSGNREAGGSAAVERASVIARIERDATLLGRHTVALNGGARRQGALTHSAYLLLACLEAGGPMSIAELASRVGVDLSTMNRQTSALLRDGHAERIADPDGGIARKFRVTPAGAAAYLAEWETRQRGIDGILDEWSAADREAFAGLLHRFNLGVEERTGHHWPRGD